VEWLSKMIGHVAICACIWLLWLPHGAFAQSDPTSGLFWREICVPAEHSQCISYIAGLNGANDYLELALHRHRLWCPTPSATIEQERLVVLKIMDDHPEWPDGPFALLAIAALATAFPCSK